MDIFCYLHFTDIDKEVDKNDNNYDRLWKIKEVFDILGVVYSKFYNPSEHLAIDEVIVRLKEKVAIRQYTPKKHTFQN